MADLQVSDACRLRPHRQDRIVTGANTGIGQGIAVALAEAGARRSSAVGRSSMDETAAHRRRRRRGASTRVTADLGSIEPIERDASTEACGRGRPTRHPGQQCRHHPPRRRRRLHRGRLGRRDRRQSEAAFFLSPGRRPAHASRDGRRGKIVNIASLLSFQGGIRVPSYTASQAAASPA